MHNPQHCLLSYGTAQVQHCFSQVRVIDNDWQVKWLPCPLISDFLIACICEKRRCAWAVPYLLTDTYI